MRGRLEAPSPAQKLPFYCPIYRVLHIKFWFLHFRARAGYHLLRPAALSYLRLIKSTSWTWTSKKQKEQL